MDIAPRAPWGRSAKWTYSSSPCCEVLLATSGIRRSALEPSPRIDLKVTAVRSRVGLKCNALLRMMLMVGIHVLSLSRCVHRSQSQSRLSGNGTCEVPGKREANKTVATRLRKCHPGRCYKCDWSVRRAASQSCSLTNLRAPTSPPHCESSDATRSSAARPCALLSHLPHLSHSPRHVVQLQAVLLVRRGAVQHGAAHGESQNRQGVLGVQIPV